MKSLEDLSAADFASVFEQHMQAAGTQYTEDIQEKTAEIFTLFPEELLKETPAATILVPVKLPATNIENALHTLRLTQRAARQTGPLEILLWANKRMIRDDNASPEAWEQKVNEMAYETEKGFGELVAAVDGERFDPNLVRIRPKLDYVDEDATMRDIRDVAMDCIGYDALERRLPHDLAVIWIDADTTFISQNAISSIISRLKNDFDTFLVQPNLIFTGHQGDTRPMRERESSEKYAALYAIARRMFEKNTGHNASKTYLEECGIGMRLGDYFAVNGLRAQYPEYRNIGETARLRNNAKDIGIAATFAAHEPDARIGTSYRSIKMQADYFPPDGNFSGVLTTQSYLPFSQIKEIADENGWVARPRITEATAHKLVYDLSMLYKTSPTKRQARTLDGIIKRFEFPSDIPETSR